MNDFNLFAHISLALEFLGFDWFGCLPLIAFAGRAGQRQVCRSQIPFMAASFAVAFFHVRLLNMIIIKPSIQFRIYFCAALTVLPISSSCGFVA